MSASNFSLKNNPSNVWVKRIIAIAVLAGFAWLVIAAITTSVDDEELEPSLVKAPALIKQRPDAPGGMKIDHQDKQLFDLLESETSEDEVNNSVLAKAKAIEEQNEKLAKQAVEKKVLAEKVEAVKPIAKKVEVVVEKAKTVETKVAEVKKSVEVKKVEPVKQAPAETTKTAVKPQSEVKGWVVQLGSFRKTTDAERAVGVYNKKVGNILVGLNSYIKKVDLGAKGIVYRVYFTGLKDSEHAKQICSQLKAQKQACLRAKL